jgi:lysylphosphatidylglycerol synthetase-like protein (DUF2156 family)
MRRPPRLITAFAALCVLAQFIACLWASIVVGSQLKDFVDIWWALSVIAGLPLGIVVIVMFRRLERRALTSARRVTPRVLSCALVATFSASLVLLCAFTGELYVCAHVGDNDYDLTFLSQPPLVMLLTTYALALFAFWLLDRARDAEVCDLLTLVHGAETVEMRFDDAVSALAISDAVAGARHDD